MSYGIIQSDTFTSDGNAKILVLRSDLDSLMVYNYTELAATNNRTCMSKWQRGMSNGTGINFYKDGGGDNLNVGVFASPNGFTLLDTSVQTLTSNANDVTQITNATPPVITSVAHGLITGDIVRLNNLTGALQMCGIDFHVTRVTADTFSLTYATGPAATLAGLTGGFTKISNENVWVPKMRIITNITQAANAVIRFAAPHDFQVGQQVRVKLSNVFGSSVRYGMTQINEKIATVTAVNSASTNSITTDIDSSGFTAFAFPISGDEPFTPAYVEPVGLNLAYMRNNSLDEFAAGIAFNDTAYIGIKLAGGNNTPAGGNGDVIYWEAHKSWSNGV